MSREHQRISETALFIRLPEELRRRLTEVARREDRTVAAEARLAIRRHVDEDDFQRAKNEP